MLDTTYAIETPEGIDLTLRPAGPLARIMAYGIDLTIRAVIMMACGTALAFSGQFGLGLLTIIYFLLEWFYPVLFEVYGQGMTPGKRSMGIRVVNDDGTPVGWNNALIRNLLRAVDFLPMMYAAGLVSMVLSSHFKRLGDLAAGTLVVYLRTSNPAAVDVGGGVRPLPVSLQVEEQRALLDFVESSNRLSAQRQEELANILTPLSGKQGREGVEELTRFANGLAGRQ